jgi:hypothetical protein
VESALADDLVRYAQDYPGEELVMAKIRVEYRVPVRCVTELEAADVEAAMRSGYDLDGFRPENHPAADIARCLRFGVPVTGPWRMAGTVVRNRCTTTVPITVGWRGRSHELGVNPPLLACPVPPDDMGKNRADVDEVQDVRVFPVAG